MQVQEFQMSLGFLLIDESIKIKHSPLQTKEMQNAQSWNGTDPPQSPH